MTQETTENSQKKSKKLSTNKGINYRINEGNHREMKDEKSTRMEHNIQRDANEKYFKAERRNFLSKILDEQCYPNARKEAKGLTKLQTHKLIESH